MGRVEQIWVLIATLVVLELVAWYGLSELDLETLSVVILERVPSIWSEANHSVSTLSSLHSKSLV